MSGSTLDQDLKSKAYAVFGQAPEELIRRGADHCTENTADAGTQHRERGGLNGPSRHGCASVTVAVWLARSISRRAISAERQQGKASKIRLFRRGARNSGTKLLRCASIVQLAAMGEVRKPGRVAERQHYRAASCGTIDGNQPERCCLPCLN